ncbi:MAG TPA: hypothetical protein VKA67_00085 [Verrucomicrobiae bacterium]|nr:hypothetical protein [Verrucomicrobiae bacterium]
MKKVGWLFACWLAFASVVSAQVTVQVKLDQDQFLPGEAVPVKVRITNLSGQTLHLGADPNWLTFDVESKDNFIIPKYSNPPVQGAFNLESSKVAIKRVNLAPHFSLTRPGRYEVIATVRIDDWHTEISSDATSFTVIQGAKLWEQTIGVPNPDGKDRPPQIRKYILQQANYLRSQLKLYLRLTDESGAKVYKVFPIGPMVSFSQPEPQVDRYSNLHVLYQNGPHTFSYTVIDPDGNIIARQTYVYVGDRPRLRANSNGDISVYGGVREKRPDDIPSASELKEIKNDFKP